MARKKNKRGESKSPGTSLATLDASVKQLQSLLSHPDLAMWMHSGAASGIRKKFLSVDYSVLRNVAQRIPLIGAIVNTRIDQLLPYCKPAVERDEKGFEILSATGGKPKEKDVAALTTFFGQTGFVYDDDREDDLMDYIQMVARDILEIDQIATEVQYNRKGEAIAFWALDGASIHRVDPERANLGKNVRYVQMIDSQIYNTYTHETLLFDYKNKRTDLRFRGYGYSAIEQTIDLATTLLFGYNHMQDLFVKDRIPKGFISVMGDVGTEQIQSLQRYWYAAMSGSGGRWNIPILPSGKEGVGIDFKNIGQSNRDMEYHKLMMFLSSILGAVFSIDLAEMGIKTDQSQALIGEDSAPRLQASKDRGLGSLLMFLQQHLNKVLRKVTTDYALRFIGFDIEDEDRRSKIDSQRLKTTRTINELREEEGADPIEAEYANVVLNEQAIQIYMAEKQAQQQEQMAAEGGVEESEDEGEEFDWSSFDDDRAEETEEDAEIEETSEEMFKSLTAKKVRRIMV